MTASVVTASSAWDWVRLETQGTVVRTTSPVLQQIQSVTLAEGVRAVTQAPELVREILTALAGRPHPRPRLSPAHSLGREGKMEGWT